MIQMRTILEVADNSGAKRVQCIKVLGGSRRRYAQLGDVIVVSIKEALPGTKVKKGETAHAVVVRTSSETSARGRQLHQVRREQRRPHQRRSDEPIGTRIFGPVARELRAQEVHEDHLARAGGALMAARIRQGRHGRRHQRQGQGQDRARSLRVLRRGRRVRRRGGQPGQAPHAPTPRNPPGGILEREQPLHACKVMPSIPKTGKGTRVRFKSLENGKQGSRRGQERGTKSSWPRSNRSWQTRKRPRASSRRSRPRLTRATKPGKPGKPTRVSGRRARRAPRRRTSARSSFDDRGRPAAASREVPERGHPRADQAVQLQEPDAGAAPRRRSWSTWASAPPSRTRRSSTRRSRRCKAITGQKPVVTRAKKAIANFKLRAGHSDRRDGHAPPRAHVGVPRSPRDASRCRACATSRACRARPSTARATTRSGSREQIIFPEIDYDKIDVIKGMNISFVTTAKTDEEGRALLQQLGMPFRAT